MTDEPTTTGCCASRRRVLQGAALAPVAVATLAGCGGQEEAPAVSTAGDGALVVPASGVPVGGSTYYADAQVVVTQPTEGEFRAFDATCPHQGCMTSSSGDGELVCPCHGSRFALDTGDVVQGPATRGLTALAVTVEGGDLQIRG